MLESDSHFVSFVFPSPSTQSLETSLAAAIPYLQLTMVVRVDAPSSKEDADCSKEASEATWKRGGQGDANGASGGGL
jgi:hypothetical protein